MSPLQIASSQPAGGTGADSASGAPASDSDFGPILQAASASPGAPARNASGPAARDGSGRAPAQADATASGSSQAPDEPGNRPAARRGGRSSVGPQPESDAAAAAAAACALAPGRLSQPDTAAARRDAGITCASTDASRNSGRSIEAPAGSSRAADAAALAQDAGADGAGSAPQPAAGTDGQNHFEPPPIAGSQLSRAQTGRLDKGEVSRPLLQASDPAGGTASEMTGAGVDSASSFGTALPGPAFSASQAAQAVAQALASVADDSATPHPSAGASATAPEPAGTPGVAAGAGFGPVTNYVPEGRASVSTPVGQPEFGQELSERVVVLTRSGAHTAQISLEPAGLGPVGVSIQVHGHAATLVFTAAHEATRNALEAALPRLREMFASSGMQLADASVGGRAQSDWTAPSHSQAGRQRGDGGSDAADLPASEAAGTARAAAVRLVDIYA